jgi:hypothetical protein
MDRELVAAEDKSDTGVKSASGSKGTLAYS